MRDVLVALVWTAGAVMCVLIVALIMSLTTEIIRLRRNNAALLGILASQCAPEAAKRERETAAEAERRRKWLA